MITREKVETLLRINGVEPVAPENEIRSILLSARFNDDEVNAALMVLRENTVTKQTNVQTAHKIFRSDQSLNPKEISQLLGINVSVEEFEIQKHQVRQLSHTQFLMILMISVAIAISSLTFIMYVTQIGFFHPKIGAFTNIQE